MTDRHRHSPDSGSPIDLVQMESLPSDFSDADRAVDRQLAALARVHSSPAGMEDRVFAASRDLLPGCGSEQPAESLRFPIVSTSGTLTRRFGVPLATAAAVGLLAVVTWWSTWQGASPTSVPRDMAAEGVMSPSSGNGELLAVRDVSWHAADVLDAAYQRISTFVVASEELRSTAELEAELLGIFPELATASLISP